MTPNVYQLINFSASLGTALLAVWVGQQMVNERLLSQLMEVAHRIVIVIVSLAFLINAMADRGASGAFLAGACFAFFLLRVLARHRYPHGHRAAHWF
jgi:Na+/H+-dicarboxylate symporter